jgi:hypothetical protein
LRALLLALVIVLPFVQPVYALDDLDEWDFSTDSNGTVVVNEDGSVTLGGANNPLPEQPRWNALTSLTTTALEAETAQYLWSYLTTDGAFYDKPQYLVGGEWLTLAEGNTQSATGYIEVVLAAGDLFGFRVLSTDSCCGIGFLTIAVGSPTPQPTPTPTPEPTPEPTPTQTPEPPSPSPSVAPTPTPEPSVEPEPTPQPTPETTPEPTPTPTEEPSPEVTNAPTPQPTPEPTPAPTEVAPSPSVSPDPTPVPTPEPEPALPVVGAAVEAVGEVFANIAAITEIGKDLDPIEKEEAQPVAVSIIASQVASVAAAASNAARAAANIGGGGPAGGNGNTPSRKGGRRA